MAPQALKPEPAQSTQNGTSQHRCRPSVNDADTATFEAYRLNAFLQKQLACLLKWREYHDVVPRRILARQRFDNRMRLLKTTASVGQTFQKETNAHTMAPRQCCAP